MTWMNQLIVAPILLPLLTAAIMLWLGEKHRPLKAQINLWSSILGLGISISLFMWVQTTGTTGSIGVYLPGNWEVPFGIVLVVDHLSAMMLVLTGIVGVCALLFALARWDRAGASFHALFQIQLMGLYGAFLTADLFNLFVFFEMMLAASYGLLLHGSGPMRVKAGLHYIAINLAASSLFLVGVSLIYGATGTLNMADLAMRITTIGPESRMLMEAGAAILGIAFLVKAGMWPLGFWLPATYSAATPPVAAIFAILTKVGVYILLRLSMLLFGADAGASLGFGQSVLLYGGLLTIGFGAIGVLASQAMGRLAGYCVLVSSGTLMAAIGLGNGAVIGGALFYLVSSTLTICAFFLLIELVERARDAGADVLAVTMEAYGDVDENEAEKEGGVAVPGTMAVLGLCFCACAILLSGLPPLSGFLAKFAMLHGLFNPGSFGDDAPVSGAEWAYTALLILSGLAAMIAMNRVGIRTFWTSIEGTIPRVFLIEITPVLILLAACVFLSFQAGPVMRYMDATAKSLGEPQNYIGRVMSAPLAGPAAGE